MMLKWLAMLCETKLLQICSFSGQIHFVARKDTQPKVSLSRNHLGTVGLADEITKERSVYDSKRPKQRGNKDPRSQVQIFSVAPGKRTLRLASSYLGEVPQDSNEASTRFLVQLHAFLGHFQPKKYHLHPHTVFQAAKVCMGAWVECHADHSLLRTICCFLVVGPHDGQTWQNSAKNVSTRRMSKSWSWVVYMNVHTFRQYR